MASGEKHLAEVREAEWDAAEADGQRTTAHRNRRTLIILGLIGFGMFGFAFANVPLFNMLCRQLGFGQNPNTAAVAASDEVSDREVEVMFMGNVIGQLPIAFNPVTRIQRVKLGEQALNDYHFVNMSSRPIYFRPVHSVRPTSAAQDQFHLSKCFCFDDQMMHPHQEVTLPVVYKIGTGLDSEVSAITLNYSLFEITKEDYEASTARKEAGS